MDAFRAKLRVVSRCFFQLTRRHKRNIRYVLCTIVVTLVFHRVFHYMHDDYPWYKLWIVSANTNKADFGVHSVPLRTVGSKKCWRSEKLQISSADWDGTPCEESRCQITFDRSLLNVSDAVLFHAVAFSPRLDIEQLTRNRLPVQRWVLYSKESPGVLSIGPRYNGLYINWTATYRRDSDLFVPYGYYASLKIQNKPVGGETSGWRWQDCYQSEDENRRCCRRADWQQHKLRAREG